MADLVVKTYDPKLVIAVLGVVQISGFMPGTFISIERNGELFTKVRGADGNVDRVNKSAHDFKVTFTLKQVSPVNAILSGLAMADAVSNTGILPLIIRDAGGTSLFVAASAWIAADPSGEFSDEMSARTWVIETGIGSHLVGGN